jgi:glucose/arabinose dehydrogenase
MTRAIAFGAALVLSQVVPMRHASAQTAVDDWEVLPGFSLSIDTQGYTLPTAIAFVPHPGNRPSDPLYYVTELGGTVKVVTNDRTVHVFAEGLSKVQRVAAKGNKPERIVEQGAAGICLDAKRGYVFVTFGFRDSAHVRRNGMVRYSTGGGTFAIKPVAVTSFTSIFAADTSAESHQVGGCQVDGDVVYVGTGDGEAPYQSRRRASTLGKVLRIDVDGRPAPGNPFADGKGAGRYVWAMGFRNPFGVKLIGRRLYVADNGMHIDRFLEIARGGDYLWDGTDWSIGTNPVGVIAPSVAPVQLAYLDAGSGLFPEQYEGVMYAAFSGDPLDAGPGDAGQKSIAMVRFDSVSGRMSGPPQLFLRFRGHRLQLPVGVGIGGDGLYFVPMLPSTDGTSAVLKVRYDPMHAHRFIMGRTPQAATLIADKGCLGCHVLNGEGGSLGPSLDQPDLARRLMQRLESREYAESVAELDTVTDPAISTWRAARHAVLEAKGSERVRRWLTYRIMNPRFDSPAAMMPNLGVTEYQATLVASHLMDAGNDAEVQKQATTAADPHLHRIVAFLLGMFVSAVGMLVLNRRRAR